MSTSLITSLEKALAALVVRVVERSNDRAAKLDGIIHAATPSEDDVYKLATIKRVRRIMDLLNDYVRLAAVPSMLLAYDKHDRDAGAVETQNWITFFLFRIRDIDNEFAMDLASALSRAYGTLAPIDVLERKSMDYSPANYGDKQVELSEEVAALYDALFRAPVSLDTIETLIGCIGVANKTCQDFYRDAQYDRIRKLIDDYNIEQAVYMLPQNDYDGEPMSPQAYLTKLAKEQLAKASGDVRPLLEPYLLGWLPRTRNSYEQKELQGLPYLQGLKAKYMSTDIAEAVADLVIDSNCIHREDRALFIYVFFGYGEPSELKPLPWQDHTSKGSKTKGKVGHPTELYYLLTTLYDGWKGFSCKKLLESISFSDQTREKVAQAIAEKTLPQLAQRAPHDFIRSVETILK